MSAVSKMYGEDRDCLEEFSLSSQQPCQITPAMHETCYLGTFQPHLLHSAGSLQQSSCPAWKPPHLIWAADPGASTCGSDLQPWGSIFHRAYWYVGLTQGFFHAAPLSGWQLSCLLTLWHIEIVSFCHPPPYCWTVQKELKHWYRVEFSAVALELANGMWNRAPVS